MSGTSMWLSALVSTGGGGTGGGTAVTPLKLAIAGTPMVGEWLTAVFTGATGSVQWLRDGNPVPGAATVRYLAAAADAGRVLSVRSTSLESALVDLAGSVVLTSAGVFIDLPVLDTRARYGYGGAGALDDPQALLDEMVPLDEAGFDGASGSMMVATPSTSIYAWLAVPLEACPHGLIVTDQQGRTGFWSGAGTDGPKLDGGDAVDASSETAVDARGIEWAFFRQHYPGADPAPQTYTIRAASEPFIELRPRWGVGPADAHVHPALLVAGMVAIGSTRGGVAGQFSGMSGPDEYLWYAADAGPTEAGVMFSDADGDAGGWAGAGRPGPNLDGGPERDVSDLVVDDGSGVLLRLFRQDFPQANPDLTTWVAS